MNTIAALRLGLLVSLAMSAFAANSIICRAALRAGQDIESLIDPASYTIVRIFSGAVVLLCISLVRNRGKFSKFMTPGDSFSKRLLAPAMLVVYATGFSFAYIGLDTASGTLILFAMVQITMIAIGILAGEIPRPVELLGLVLASGGLVYLVFPNLQTPLLKESLMMAIAGVAWGVYSFLGKSAGDPISATTFNFVSGFPLVLLACFAQIDQGMVTSKGILLATLSGGIASGLGYVLWYLVLPYLRSAQAATVQLSVPILAALGGILFIGDSVQVRTWVSGVLILTGIALTIKRPKQTEPNANDNLSQVSQTSKPNRKQ